MKKYGISAIRKHAKESKKLEEKKFELEQTKIAELTKQMGMFKEQLEKFAMKHRQELRKNGEFRRHFQEMCATVGVDPLASSKGYWSELLGIGDFYYEIGVQIIEICLATQHLNGGLMEIGDLKRKLNESRPSNATPICEDDVQRTVDKLSVLGNGFQLMKLSNITMIRSLPIELSMDHLRLIELAKKRHGQISLSSLEDEFKWTTDRCTICLENLISTGIAWIDQQVTPPNYWIISLFQLK
ncbi:hypothetical protein SNEBB_001795 [Seison nebaliae]|nr:hypothetical protein SNEBB_001795 [Seison nebaliae]